MWTIHFFYKSVVSNANILALLHISFAITQLHNWLQFMLNSWHISLRLAVTTNVNPADGEMTTSTSLKSLKRQTSQLTKTTKNNPLITPKYNNKMRKLRLTCKTTETIETTERSDSAKVRQFFPMLGMISKGKNSLIFKRVNTFQMWELREYDEKTQSRPPVEFREQQDGAQVKNIIINFNNYMEYN